MKTVKITYHADPRVFQIHKINKGLGKSRRDKKVARKKTLFHHNPPFNPAKLKKYGRRKDVVSAGISKPDLAEFLKRFQNFEKADKEVIFLTHFYGSRISKGCCAVITPNISF